MLSRWPISRLFPFRFVALGVIALGPLVSQVFAWDAIGHESIAIIAYSRLREDERHKLDHVVSGAPEIYGDRSGIEALEYAAIWPEKRGADGLHTAVFTAAGPLAPARANLIAAIKLANKILWDPNSTPGQKGEGLAWLVYAVGDAHEPLQCGRIEDGSGKGIRIAGVGRQKSDMDLHSFWDDGLIRSTRIQDARTYVRRRLAAMIPKVETQAILCLDPYGWVLESHGMAVAYAYLDEHYRPVTSGAVISEFYEERALALTDERLTEAGVRLGEMLKYALDQQ